MTRMSFILGALLCLGLTFGAVAAEKADFSGRWVLDLEASDSLDPLLKAQGRSWAERKVADSLTVTQTMVQSEGTLKIHIQSAVNERDELLKLDGSTETVQSERAGPVQTRTFWAEDGKVLTTVNTMTLPDGTKADMHVVRRLTEPGTMRQDLELHLADGRILRAKRVLKKSDS